MSRAEIETDIAAARDRLAGNIAELITQVHPRSVLSNTVTDAREFAAEEVRQVKDQLVGEDGLRVERLALLAAAVGGAIAFVMVLRSIFRGR